MRTDAWARFWHAPVAPHPVAAGRILLGVFLFGYLLTFWPAVELRFSRQGVYRPVFVPDYAPAPPLAWARYLRLFAARESVAAGESAALVGRGLFALFLHHWFLHLGAVRSAHDSLVLVCLAALTLGRLDGAWALAGRPAATVSAWPARVLALQSAALYFGAGIWKLPVPAWRSGEAIAGFLIGPDAGAPARWIASLGFPPSFYLVASWGVIAFELLMGPALFWRRTRRVAVALGVLFHVSIAVVLTLPEFLVAIALYPAFFAERPVHS